MSKNILDSKSHELRYTDVSKLLLKYSIPSVVSMLVVALYNIVDRVYIGQGLGAMAISGLSLTLPLAAMITAVGTLVGIGASARVSIVLGMKDVEWARNILCHYPILMLGISLVTMSFLLLFLEPLLLLFGGTENTIPYAIDYLEIVLPASVFTNLCYGFSHILRASGYPTKSMVAILIGVVTNIILDPIFLFVFDMGIRGVAIATAISMALGALYSVLHFLNREHSVSFHWESFRFKPQIVKNIVSIGFSPFIMNLVAAMVGVVFNIQLSKYGGDFAIGAFGIIYSYQLFLALLIMGVVYAMQPITGYNYGANNLKRVKDVFFLTVKVSTLISIPFFLMAQFGSELLTRAFTSDPELMVVTENAFRLSFFGVIAMGLPISTSILFLSISRAKKSVFMSLARQVVFLAPLLFILPLFWGLNGVWLSMAISDILAFFTGSIFMISELRVLYPHKLRSAIPTLQIFYKKHK